MIHVVLRTIAEDGTSLIHLPTAERIVSEHDSYLEALDAARALRTSTYRHKVTGEVRQFTALQTDGCAFAKDQSVWDFVSHAEYVRGGGGYALAVEKDDLIHYEPNRKGALY